MFDILFSRFGIVLVSLLMLGAFAEAARVLNEAKYLEVAKANVKLVREKLFVEGRLLHTYKAGTAAKINGLLDGMH